MAEEFYTMPSGAKRYQGWADSTDDRDITVILTNDAPTNDSNITAAVAQLNTWGNGTLWLEGAGPMTGYHIFTGAQSLRMRGAYSLLEVQNDLLSGFEWSPSYSPLTETNFAAGPIVKGTESIPSPNLSLQPGDWFEVWSDDALTGFNPAFTNAYPMEMHRCLAMDGTNILFDDFAWDAMSTNVRICKVPQQRHVVIDGLKVKFTGVTQSNFTRFLLLQTCTDFRIANCWFDVDGPGSILMNHCGSGVVENCIIEGAAKNDNGIYGIVSGVVNDVKITDCSIKGTRHPYTTTYGPTDGSTYSYGTPRNVRIVNCHAQTSGISSGGAFPSSKIMFDVHPSSGNVLFDSCKAIAPGLTAVITGFQSRGSGTIFKGCTSQSPRSGNGTGFRPSGDNILIDECSAEGGWRGVLHFHGDNVRVVGGTITQTKGPAIQQELTDTGPGAAAGDNLYIDGVQITDCGHEGAQPLIRLNSMGKVGHRIHRCDLTKQANGNSIHLGDVDMNNAHITGNTCLGYGVGTLGITGDGTNGSDMDAAWLDRNWSDA